jgi:hypothetical protein
MNRSRRLTLASLLLTAALAVALLPAAAIGAGHPQQQQLQKKKKKKKGGGTFTNASPVALGASATTAPFTSAKSSSSITVPKKKKALIKDVNVGVRLNVNGPSFTTSGISLLLVAPNGQTQSLLFGFDTGGTGTEGLGLGSGPSNCSSGTMLFDDQSHKQFISSTPPRPPSNPSGPYDEGDSGTNPAFDEFTAFPPYAGSVQPDGLLSAFDGEQAKGAWSLVLLNSNFPDTATLVCWQLQIKPQPVVKQANKKKHHK